MAAAERIFGLLDTEPDVKDRSDAKPLSNLTGHVRFEDVSFAYNEGDWVLRDVQLEAKPGETVAFVGPTGAGKSSIINLVCRFYEQQEGRITVDGHDLREVTMHSLRSQMGIVMQEPFLFSGTVMDNIKFARPEATDEEVYEAARTIGAHDIIDGLRDGYRTQVQERGEGLSGGERQLVCFTRAMVADPRVLVLDEATSSVDTTTELRIQNALDHLVRRRTSFVVAHRLSTVRNANQVLVVNDGRIVERGTHDELLAAGGEYARMYTEFLREG
jgi:ATP-binding cassette subfamily B protein